MTQDQYVIRRKLNILELGETLGNISEACRKLQMYRDNIITTLRLLSKKTVWMGSWKSLERFHGQEIEWPRRLSRRFQIILQNSTFKARSGCLMNSSNAENEGILTESQVQALEQAKEEKEAHGEIETPHPGFLLGQDTCYIGYIKGVGKIYQQTAIDTHSNVGFAKVYPDKTALTAADFLNNKVLPFFDSENMELLRILTDRGTEYCGRIETHPYQLFLHLNGIEHSRTKVRHPQTNGSTERLNQIVQNEFYKVAFRKKIYKSIEEIQVDLDTFMKNYNTERTYQGKHCQGRTPMQTFQDGRPLYQQYVFENSEEEKTAA